MSHLFEPIQLRSLMFRNRIGVSPMCQYSCENGLATDWHLVHLGSRAVGGAGLVVMEATAVTPEGRISDGDHGLWSDAHTEALARITHFIKEAGAAAGIQLAHAGRKASRSTPWTGDRDLNPNEGGWKVLAPSPLAFSEGYQVPHEMSVKEIAATVQAFASAAARALEAGFNLVEIHAAHGYLLHSFLSPLSNQRKDEYGGSLANRCRIVLETIRATRKVWPDHLPLALRISASDWIDGGWDGDDSVALSKMAASEGVDLIDCSSGGNVAKAPIPVGANYQVPFAAKIKKETGIPTAAVGLITEAMQADGLIRNGQADFVFLAREFLRDPYWPLHAAQKLRTGTPGLVPKQYGRAFPGIPS